jgi:hypothetical protein
LLLVDIFVYFSKKMSLLEHPRLTVQREKRQRLLAKIQFENGWSREEMAEHFRQEAEAKINPVVTVATVVYNSADIVLAYLTPPRRKKK